MTAVTLPPEAQQVIAQLQTFQQQLQATLIQKETLTVQKIEIEKALKELEKTEEKENVYKIVGPLLVKTKKERLVNELKEKLEEIEVRIKSLEKVAKKLEEKIQEKQEKLRSFFEGSTSSAAQ